MFIGGLWIASGCAIKRLVIVDAAAHEAVALIPEHAIADDYLVQRLEDVCARLLTSK